MQVDKQNEINRLYEISGEKYRDMLLGSPYVAERTTIFYRFFKRFSGT